MRRYLFALLLGVLLGASPQNQTPASANAHTQPPPPFPLPAPLYFLTSEHQLVRMGAERGDVVPLSDLNQPIADFDIAADGDWVAYRTLEEGRVLIANWRDGRGQVLAMSGETAPQSSARQTIAWSPKGDAVAYILAGEGVRVRSLVVSEEATSHLVRGNWVELYWTAEGALLVSDEAGHVTRLTWQGAQITLTAAPNAPARPQPRYPAYLSAQGIVYNGVPIPNTAGALAFDWGAPPLPTVEGLALPADLFFLVDGALWRAPKDGRAAHALVQARQRRVWAYAPSPDGTQVAYVIDAANGGFSIHIVNVASGADRALTATLGGPLPPDNGKPAWQPGGNHLAYADSAGVWLLSLEEDAPPTLLFPNQGLEENATPHNVRRYHTPCWSPDGAQLLVTVDLWESRQWLIYDVARQATRTLHVPAMAVRWADETHLLAWSWSWSVYFEAPALYLVTLDPTAESTLTPLLSGQAIYDWHYTPQTGLYVLASPTMLSGPAYAQVQRAETLAEPKERLPLGSFVDVGWGAKTVRLSPPSAEGLPALAILQHPTQQAGDDTVFGELAVVTAEQAVRIAGHFAPERVHALGWGH